MEAELLSKLEEKIESAIETIELLRLQLEELENKRAFLINENQNLQKKQSVWEQNLAVMLEKLEHIENSDPIKLMAINTINEAELEEELI